jgi:glycosyltransferase involved in cell wall biosynthesis
MSTFKKIFTEEKNIEIIYSIVTPVFNQEEIIVDNLKSVIMNTLENFEIIVILDFCFDNTEKNLMYFLENYKNNIPNFIQITIFKNENIPLFETKCDNIGFKNSVGKYCLEIQADMKMVEYGYNIHLTKPFLLLDNVIAVSGRCAHNLFNSNGVGKLGATIETNIEYLGVDKNKFYVYETCNRGPLLLDREKLKEMDYLDEKEYFLDNSDHDLMARAYLEKKYICGYVPIEFYAPLFLGSIRNNKNYSYCEEYLVNKNEKNRLSNIPTLGISKYKEMWIERNHIVYDI